MPSLRTAGTAHRPPDSSHTAPAYRTLRRSPLQPALQPAAIGAAPSALLLACMAPTRTVRSASAAATQTWSGAAGRTPPTAQRPVELLGRPAASGWPSPWPSAASSRSPEAAPGQWGTRSSAALQPQPSQRPIPSHADQTSALTHRRRPAHAAGSRCALGPAAARPAPPAADLGTEGRAGPLVQAALLPIETAGVTHLRRLQRGLVRLQALGGRGHPAEVPGLRPLGHLRADGWHKSHLAVVEAAGLPPL
ncbi:hypothetical protein ON010_g14186 [Phytophthora cinnamomi]|nr:hypothetical protein ON010_g14186 [Phytophthora cinnamomi]